MVSVLDLWLPILLSALGVFFMSFVMQMISKHHVNDIRGLKSEDEVLNAIRRENPEPAAYALPYATRDTMNSPEYVAKRSAGPVAFVTVLPGGPPTMGKELAGWFVYVLVVSVFAAYVAGRALGVGPIEYLDAFRFAGTAAFLAYAMGQPIESIWWGRPWSNTLKNMFDGLVYALVTAGIFGWLWPGAGS